MTDPQLIDWFVISTFSSTTAGIVVLEGEGRPETPAACVRLSRAVRQAKLDGATRATRRVAKR
jgi:hypothetical protein